jgi:hypothetical protein
VLGDAVRVASQCNTLANSGVKSIRQAVRAAIEKENTRCRVNLEAQVRARVLKQQADEIVRASVRALDDKMRLEAARVDAIDKERERLRHCFQTEKRKLFLQDAQEKVDGCHRQHSESHDLSSIQAGGYAASHQRRNRRRSRSMISGSVAEEPSAMNHPPSNASTHCDNGSYADEPYNTQRGASRPQPHVDIARQTSDESSSYYGNPRRQGSETESNEIFITQLPSMSSDFNYHDAVRDAGVVGATAGVCASDLGEDASIYGSATSLNSMHRMNQGGAMSVAASRSTASLPSDQYWYYIDEHNVRQVSVPFIVGKRGERVSNTSTAIHSSFMYLSPNSASWFGVICDSQIYPLKRLH